LCRQIAEKSAGNGIKRRGGQMSVDALNAVWAYIFDVFVVRLDWWVTFGFTAQALFGARFFVQWIASERAGKSVVPFAFWLLSIGGATLMVVYALTVCLSYESASPVTSCFDYTTT
jgi:lipid-A-disaccharide synthase-like uncharacterized protein